MSLTYPTIAPLTRRRFLAAAGATALDAKTHALPPVRRQGSRFAFAASPGELRVFATQTTPWTHIQSVPSEAPASLVVDPRTRALHILHEVAEHQGLPCGYIESFCIEPRTGRLTLLSRQPLSLSAINPRHMTLSPDGKTLAVAIHGGSAYNLLPIHEDGRPGRPIAIRKETGLSTSSLSRPGQVAFSPTSDCIYALDQGTATLSLFAAQPELPILTRFPLPPDSSPRHLALYPSANLLFLTVYGDGSLRTLRLHPQNAAITETAPPIYGNFLGPVAIHAPSRTLVAWSADTLNAFRIDPVSGALFRLHQFGLPDGSHELNGLVTPPSEQALIATTSLGVLRFDVDPSSGLLDSATLVAAGPARAISFI